LRPTGPLYYLASFDPFRLSVSERSSSREMDVLQYEVGLSARSFPALYLSFCIFLMASRSKPVSVALSLLDYGARDLPSAAPSSAPLQSPSFQKKFKLRNQILLVILVETI